MAQSSAVNQPVRIPLATNIRARNGFFTRDSPSNGVVDPQLVNCYAEFNPDTKTFNVQKRPGYSAPFFTPTSAVGQGIFQFVPNIIGNPVTNNDSLVAINNGEVFLIYDIDSLNLTCSSIKLGDVDTTGGVYRGIVMPFATFSNSRVLVIGNGVKAYITSGLVAGDLAQILDPQFPTLFYKGWAYLNSRLYLGEPNNKLRGAENINDPTMWETLNVILAQDEGDNGVALAKHSSFIVFFKETSTEFFFDNGNPVGSPLLPSPQNSYDIGCADADSVRDIDGTLFWVVLSKIKTPQIARMDGNQYTIISTPEIEKILMTNGPGFKAITMKIAGHRFYILTIGTFVTLVYDLDQQLWYVWEGDFNSQGSLNWPISDAITTSQSLSSGETFNVLQDSRNGKLYLAGPDYSMPTDDTFVFAVDIYTPNFDAGVDRKKQVNMMYFDADRVDGSELQIRTNDWDYDPKRWSEFRTVNLDCEKPQLANCGSFYRRAHHIRHQMPCSFIIRSVGLQTDIGVA